MDNLQIGFICKNYAKVHSEGKLKLAFPFVLEYGCSIPEKVYIELPSGEFWFGKYVKESEYIEGLEKMISFYGVRPYHMVVFQYCGGPNFKLNVFNECGVEICYPFSCPSSCNLRLSRNDPYLVVRSSMKLTEIEIDKLAATFSFNALHNFAGLHDIIIRRSYLSETSKYEVMSSKEFEKLGMDEGVNTVEFGFEHYYWTIRVMQRNGVLFFNHGWYEFVKAANLCEGDVCVIQRTAACSRFKIAVFPKNLLTQWSSTADNRIALQRFSWFKIMKGSCLYSGKVEMPRLIAMRLGTELGTQIQFKTADGRCFRGKFSVSKKQISGLKDMISTYDIYHNCVIVFYYVGNSIFNVSIFDSQNVDHLKEITGEFIADIVRELRMNELESGSVNEDETEAGVGFFANHEEDVDDDVMSTDQSSDQFVVGVGNEDDADETDDGNVEMNIAGEGSNAFVVELKKSHLQEKGRGVYCSTRCYDLYRNWNSTTIVSLNFRGERFEVGVQRNNRTCRFGKGWNDFVRTTELRQGDLLEFRFLHAYNMQVSQIK